MIHMLLSLKYLSGYFYTSISLITRFYYNYRFITLLFIILSLLHSRIDIYCQYCNIHVYPYGWIRTVPDVTNDYVRI